MDKLADMLLQIIKALPLDLILLDNDSRVLAVTGHCLQNVLQRERQAVEGRPLRIALGCAEPDGSLELLAEAAAVDKALDSPVASQLVLHLPNSARPWSVRVQPLMNGDGTHDAAFLLFQEQGRSEILEKLLHASNQVAYAQETIHTAKNTLQSMDGMLQVLVKKFERENASTELFALLREDIDAAVVQLNEFCQDTRSEPIVGRFSVNELVQEAADRQRARFISGQIELQTELAGELPKIWLDKRRIKDVLINCLDNSRDAILQKGQPGGCVKIKTLLDGSVVRVLVEDNGIGLTPEQQDNFFKAYYTTKPQGTGLGTSISKAVVELHGGSMSVSGRPGEGCCVCIELPLESSKLFNHDDFFNASVQLNMGL